jgi:hypothetical protein
MIQHTPENPTIAPARAQGAVLMLVLIAVAIAVVLGMTFSVTQATTLNVAANASNAGHARQIAVAGVELAMGYVRNNTDWRTQKVEGNWFTGYSLDGGTVTVNVKDGEPNSSGVVVGDGSLSDHGTDSFTLTATGTYSGSMATVVGVVRPKAVNNGKILMIVADATNPTTEDTLRQALLVKWGYTVTLLSASATQSDYNTAVAAATCVYITAGASVSAVGTKLQLAQIGIVCEQGGLAPNFLMSSAAATSTSSSTISIINNNIAVTSTWSTGNLSLCSSSQPMWSYGGTMATGGSVLAQYSGSTTACMVIDSAGWLTNGTGAAGRRVMLPWGATGFSFASLTSSGQTLLQNAIRWASEGAGYGGVLHMGNQTAFTTGGKNVSLMQVATQVTLASAGTINGVTAYVNGPPPKLVRYAIYTDKNGEPDTLVTQTATGPIVTNQAHWHTLATPTVNLTAGSYWIALAFEMNNQYYYHDTLSTGKIRMRSNDAITSGFSSTWGTSSTSTAGRISIYANLIGGTSGSSGSGGTTTNSGTTIVTKYSYPVIWKGSH